MRALLIILLGSLLLLPSFVTPAAARQQTLGEKYDAEQRKIAKHGEHDADADDRARAVHLKLKRARQTRRSIVKNGDDTLDIDENIERLKRDNDVDD